MCNIEIVRITEIEAQLCQIIHEDVTLQTKTKCSFQSFSHFSFGTGRIAGKEKEHHGSTIKGDTL